MTDTLVLERRVANLRAALASIGARVDRVLDGGMVPHPLRYELGLISAACKGAIGRDDHERGELSDG